MGRRIFVCVLSCAVGFGALALATVTPADAYSTPSPGFIESIAGTGVPGYSGDNGPATSAQLGGQGDVAVDVNGNVVTADAANNVVRFVPFLNGTYYGRVMTSGDIYTIAGTGAAGYSGDSGPGSSGKLSEPYGVAFDAAGDVLIADSGNNVIRDVPMASGTFFGSPYVAGDIYTLAGNGSAAFGGDGGLAASASFSFPTGLAVDQSQNLVISDQGNNRVRVLSHNTATQYGQSMTPDRVYTIVGNGNQAEGGNGGPALSAPLSAPWGVAVDASGNVVVSDAGGPSVRVVAEASGTFYGTSMVTGDIYVIVPVDELGGPLGLALDPVGNVVVADEFSQQIWVVPAATGTYYGQSMFAGNKYAIAGNGSEGTSGDGGLALDAELSYPSGVAVDTGGDVLIQDAGSSEIRLVAPALPVIELSTASLSPDSIHQSDKEDASSRETVWTITVTNPGTTVVPSPTLGVHNFFGGGLDLVATQALGSFCTGFLNPPYLCAVPALPPGGSQSLSLVLESNIVPAGGSSSMTASVFPVSDAGAGVTANPSVFGPQPGIIAGFALAGKKLVLKPVPSPPLNQLYLAAGISVKSPKVVYAPPAPGFESLATPFAGAATVTGTGYSGTLEADSPTVDATICGGVACQGALAMISAIDSKTDTKHPAVITLSWGIAVGSMAGTHLYLREPGMPSRLVPTCYRVKGLLTSVPGSGIPATPCLAKPLKTTSKGATDVIDMLNGDPSFGRK